MEPAMIGTSPNIKPRRTGWGGGEFGPLKMFPNQTLEEQFSMDWVLT